MPTPRENIIEELKVKHCGYAFRGYFYDEEIADFIIEDRKRIITPLLNFKNKCLAYRKDSWNKLTDSARAIDETLSLALLDKE